MALMPNASYECPDEHAYPRSLIKTLLFVDMYYNIFDSVNGQRRPWSACALIMTCVVRILHKGHFRALRILWINLVSYFWDGSRDWLKGRILFFFIIFLLPLIVINAIKEDHKSYLTRFEIYYSITLKKVIGAATSENLLSAICAQRRFRSACTFTQSDQNLHWAHFGQRGKQFFFMRTTKTYHTARLHRLIWVFVRPHMSEGTFRWFKKGNCQFLAKEYAQYWLTAWRTKPAQ